MADPLPASCTCSACVSACKHSPGWFGLDDAEAALNDGLAGKMMLDWYEEGNHLTDGETVYVLAPAVEGCEGVYAPEMPFLAYGWTKGRCVLLKRNRCTIHDSGYKPVQCRALGHVEDNSANNSDKWTMMSNEIAMQPWRTERGLKLIERWRELTGFKGER